MSSSGHNALTTLADDVPTTRADVAALRRAAAYRPPDPFAALQQLIDALPPPARRPRRTTAAGRAELEL